MNELKDQWDIDVLVRTRLSYYQDQRFDGPLRKSFNFSHKGSYFASDFADEIANASHFDVARPSTNQRSALWHSKNGAFFLAGEGGADTPFASPVLNSAFVCGHACVPLSPTVAQLWLNLNGYYAESTALFGDWDGQNSPGLNFLIKPDLLFDLKILAKKYDQPVEKFIMDLLVERTQYSLLNLVRWIFKRKR
jgi:hypothetical protein